MLVREPAVAGRFYPRQSDACRKELDACLSDASVSAELAGPVLGGIVPHAGWMCSGAVAASVVRAIAGSRPVGADRPPPTAVIFGAVHVHHGARASVFPSGVWETPLGPISIDERLGARIAEAGSLVEPNAHAHEFEHSIEVEIPFIQHLLPGSRIVPIMVPPTDHAPLVGAAVARVCRDSEADVFFLGSTDLTHYGPSYDFTPHGEGVDGLNWARDENDRRMIDLILALDEKAVVPESRRHHNACGAGAIAATIAACKTLGATRALLLRHTTSYEVLSARFAETPSDAVGYAAIVFS